MINRLESFRVSIGHFRGVWDGRQDFYLQINPLRSVMGLSTAYGLSEVACALVSTADGKLRPYAATITLQR